MNRLLATSIRAVTGLLLGMTAICAVYFSRTWGTIPRASTPAVATNTREEPPPRPALSPDAWSIIRAPSGPLPSDAGPLANRFRLAGTFFLYGDAASVGEANERRRAILDDLQTQSQLIVQEEQEIDGYLVQKIERDRVRLARNGVEYEIALSFSAVADAGAAAGGVTTTGQPPPSMEDLPALETSRFGKRVGENRWVMQRDELLRYYAELLDDPERIANVYASLKPQYQGSEITGYTLNAEGEKEFFNAIGLQEGDVIRRVNSMRMVSQRRAEYFISEFMKNRVNALVFDIERGDKEEKLIYLIR